jgi:uncharacterized cupin superfamily protein
MISTKGLVVPAGGGTYLDMASPGRFAHLKLLADATTGSIMLFEETVPPGTTSTRHMHCDSDEVVWVLEGEFSFQIGDELGQGGPGTCAFLPRNVPHAWKNCGTTTGRALFLYTPAAAGRHIEEMLHPASSDAERQERLAKHHWEIVGTNPL